MIEELKPCPLCGGPAEIWKAHENRAAWVACMGRCSVYITNGKETTEQAIAAWNQRAKPHLDVDQLANIIRVVDGDNTMGAGELATAIVTSLEGYDD